MKMEFAHPQFPSHFSQCRLIFGPANQQPDRPLHFPKCEDGFFILLMEASKPADARFSVDWLDSVMVDPISPRRLTDPFLAITGSGGRSNYPALRTKSRQNSERQNL